jgi:hypothetical protein
MNVKDLLTSFFIIGSIVLGVTLIIAYLYSLVVHGNGALEWESSIRLALVLGIALPIVRQLDRKKGL